MSHMFSPFEGNNQQIHPRFQDLLPTKLLSKPLAENNEMDWMAGIRLWIVACRSFMFATSKQFRIRDVLFEIMHD